MARMSDPGTLSRMRQDDYQAEVSMRVRVALTLRRMSQTDLARQLGVGDMWVSRRLRGDAAITVTDLYDMAAALHVPVVDLLPESDLLPRLTTVEGRARRDSNSQPSDPKTDVARGLRLMPSLLPVPVAA